MRPYMLFSSILFFSLLSRGQSMEILDTIYANEDKIVALFFPEPIRRGIPGSDNFIFTYNREKEDYYGLLQATPGKESNLLVINRNGSIFSYIVRYRKYLSKLNYFIPKNSSIGNERPTTNHLASNQIRERPNHKKYYYERFCSYLLSRKQKIARLKKQTDGIVLSIENIVFDKEELYFVIQIENASSMDYDLNFLDFSITTRKKGKKKSLQSLHQKPLLKYRMPSKISKKETVQLVYVLPKFSISKERQIVLELNEKNGERNPRLKVPHKYINNPN